MERQTSTVVVFHETYWRTEYNSVGDVISHRRKQPMRESAGKNQPVGHLDNRSAKRADKLYGQSIIHSVSDTAHSLIAKRPASQLISSAASHPQA